MASAGPLHEPVSSSRDLIQRVEQNPEGLVMAARLSLYYSFSNTVLGFGEYEQPPSYLAYRLELLQAMEVFALSHEYAHFVAEERDLKFVGDDGRSSGHALELFCDELGLQISREWGDKKQNWLAFTGVGALAFFQAIDTCLMCSETLAASGCDNSQHAQRRSDSDESSHPDPRTRIANIVSNTVDKTAKDQREGVARFIGEFELICRTICNFVSEIVGDTVGHAK